MRKKTKRVEIRLDEDTARYIDLAVLFHNCTKTEFITKQIIRPEYYELRIKNIKPLSQLMGNIANNLNQVARAINILKQESSGKMTEGQFKILEDHIEKIRELLGEHDEAYRKCIMKYYRVSTQRKIRTIGEMQALDVGGDNTEVNQDGDN